MTKIVTVEEMRRIEAAADAAGTNYAGMMENAGRAVAEVVRGLIGGSGEGMRIAVLVGHGNNGGDGLVAARILKLETKAEVSCYLTKPREDDDANFVTARDAGVYIATAGDDQRWRVLKNLVSNCDILIDALLGTGARLPIAGDLKKVLTEANGALNRTRPTSANPAQLTWPAAPHRVDIPGSQVVAIDCPSGLDCDTGAIDPVAVRADVSVTFAAGKHGHFKFPGADMIGELVVAGIGIPESLAELKAIDVELATGEAVAALLPARTRDSHKGSYGKAMIVAGSINYAGAPVLAATAAYRVGAGLIRLGIPHPVYPTAAAQIPEAIYSILPNDMGAINAAAVDVVMDDMDGFNCLLVGPGLGHEAVTSEFLRKLLSAERRVKKGWIGFGAPETDPVADESKRLDVPLVIDADGLNILAETDDWPSLIPPNTILTPHIGEMARLSGMGKEAVQADRIAVAQQWAASWKCILVLKGAFTVVAAPDGRIMMLPFATDALAKAGTGDALAGCIVGLLAQGAKPFDAAVAGAYVHGLAGTLCESPGAPRSTLASEVIMKIPLALQQIEGLAAK